MCVNYAPVQRQVLRDVFGVEPPTAEWKAEAWPDYPAPILRADGDGRRESILATFGLVPRARIPAGVRPFDTRNSRSATTRAPFGALRRAFMYRRCYNSLHATSLRRSLAASRTPGGKRLSIL